MFSLLTYTEMQAPVGVMNEEQFTTHFSYVQV